MIKELVATLLGADCVASLLLFKPVNAVMGIYKYWGWARVWVMAHLAF